MLHHKLARMVQLLMIDRECCADGESGIARGRLDKDALKGRAIENLSVCQAIERDAARQAKRLLLRFARKISPHRSQNFFERGLHARGEIVVTRAERLTVLASRA